MNMHPPQRSDHPWRWRLLASLVAATLSACGGGGGGTARASLSGVAVDGYLSNATVFLDLNRDGLLTASEPSTTTDANGRYTLDYTSVSGSVSGLPIVITGGIDTDTGYAFTGRLSAPVDLAANAQVVSPLTTLVDAMVSQGMDLTAARAKVAEALGLASADALTTDPVAVMTNQPAIYTQQVALQRAVQLIAKAEARTGETAHDAQERINKALATAVRSQVGATSVGELIRSVAANEHKARGKDLADAVHDALEASLRTGMTAQVKAVLKALDQLRDRMERNPSASILSTADELDNDYRVSTSRPFRKLAQRNHDAGTYSTIGNLFKPTTMLTQPANTTGRLLASNCFQCHSTGGVGGFDRIRGSEASEVKEYLRKPARSDIMAAHAQGYTSEQLDKIIAYLQQ